jgi:putative peptidoglycan lipid II flippase
VSDDARFVAPARLIAVLTAGSRILGLLRECAYSYFFGVDPAFSAFRIAFMIPNLARRLFGEGAMSSAFIPVFTQVLHDSGRERGRRLAGTALTALGAVLVALTLAAELGMVIGHWVRPGVTLKLTMIMLPYMILICLTAFAGGMLNAVHRFAAPAAAPILLNVIVIATVCAAGHYAGLRGLDLLYLVAVSVVVAGIAQFGLQLIAMSRAQFRPVANCQWRDPDLRHTLVLMAPMVLGLSAAQFNVLADKLIAFAFVPDGRGPAVLGYAHMPYHLPVGVFGIALATAIFPLLSAKAAQHDRAGLARVFERGVRLSIFVGLPASVGLVLVATPLVALLYERGEFDRTATAHVSRTLVFYALGLVAHSVQQIVVRAFYAFKNTSTPVHVGVSVLALNVALNFALVFPMAEAGLALATAISSTVQVVWLSVALSRHLPDVRWSLVATGAARTLLAGGAMGSIVWYLLRPGVLGDYGNLVQLAVGVPVGVAVFVVTARLVGCPELAELLGRADRDKKTP